VSCANCPIWTFVPSLIIHITVIILPRPCWASPSLFLISLRPPLCHTCSRCACCPPCASALLSVYFSSLRLTHSVPLPRSPLLSLLISLSSLSWLRPPCGTRVRAVPAPCLLPIALMPHSAHSLLTLSRSDSDSDFPPSSRLGRCRSLSLPYLVRPLLWHTCVSSAHCPSWV